MDRKFIDVGLPCHKYVIRNMNCKNDNMVAAFAKSYYLLRTKDGLTDQEILAELYVLAEYAMINSGSVRPDFLHLNGVSYSETTFFSSLVKNNAIGLTNCKELVRRQLRKVEICSLCPHSDSYVNKYKLEYEKLFRTILADINNTVIFEQYCENHMIPLERFFLPVYDLGSVFTTKKPVIYPILQLLYNLYHENMGLYQLMSGMINSVRDAIFLPTIESLNSYKKLPSSIVNSPDHNQFIANYIYGLIMEEDTSIYEKKEFQEMIKNLGDCTLDFLSSTPSSRLNAHNKTTTSGTHKGSSVSKIIAASEDSMSGQATLLDNYDRTSDTEDSIIKEPLHCLSEDGSIYMDIHFCAECTNAFIDTAQEQDPASVIHPVDSKETVYTSGMCIVDELVEVVPRIGCINLKDTVPPMDLPPSSVIRKEWPILMEVVYDYDTKEDYLVFGNIRSLMSSNLYRISVNKLDTVPFGDIWGSSYIKICYNPFSLIRVLVEIYHAIQNRMPVIKNFHSLDAAYYFITGTRADFSSTIMSLAKTPFSPFLYDIFYYYSKSCSEIEKYLQRKNLASLYRNYSVKQMTYYFSYASHYILLHSSCSNVICNPSAPHDLIFNKIPSPISGKGINYIFIQVNGIENAYALTEFQQDVFFRLVDRNYFSRFFIALVYANVDRYVFMLRDCDMATVVSYLEIDFIELSKIYGYNITLSIKTL